MKTLHLASVLAVVSVGFTVVAAPVTIHVSPAGNDAWSGSLATANGARSDGPLATLPAALKAARALATDQVKDGIVISVGDGVYELAAPLTIAPDDANGARRLAIAAAPNETPVLSGGRVIKGWRPVAGRPEVWEAEIPDVRAGQWYFRQLFVNDQRRQRARTPNTGFYRIQGESPQDKPVKLHFKPGDIKTAWAADGDVEVVAFLAWADIRMQIRAVDEANHVATLSGDPRPSNRENNAQYYIENAPDGLDQPGEWYLNRRTGMVTYWPLPGEDMTKVRVVAPRLEELVRVEGDFAGKRAVEHLTLRGLTFAETDWTLGPNGYADTQAAIAVHGDVFAEAATDCTIEDCTFTRLADYALELGRGCQRWRVVGNRMFDLGAGGVRLGVPDKRGDAFEQNYGHVVTDNDIHDGGLVFAPAVGLVILQSGQNRIAHNHIHDLYYSAISVGWNWGYQETPCRENIIEFNHLHDLGKFLLSDMGAVYTLGIQKGTVIRNNLIHDVNAFTYGGWGLYTDEGSTDIVLENNVVYHCKSAGFHQHYGRDNVFRNNIFAFNRENQLMRTRAEAHISFIFTNNIVYYDSGNLLGSNWSNDHYVMDRNDYFDTRLGADAAAMRFAGATLDEWRKRGHDVNSIIADPLFVAPEKFDFRLKPESPALKLGFQPIDLSTVGVRPKDQRN